MNVAIKLLVLSVFAVAYIDAYGADWQSQGKVTRIEPTYSDHLNIKIDAAAGACAAGGWLFFYGYGATAQEKKDSVKAVYAGLLASMYAEKSIVVYGVNQGCVVETIHLLNN